MNCNELKRKSYTQYCDKRQTCTATENGRKYILKNISKKKICKIKIDGSYINASNVAKCDYGFFICNDNHMILVELKGVDLIHAIEQIYSTILLKKTEFDDLIISARIVLTRVDVPNIENKPKFLKLKKIIRQKKGSIKYKSRILIENI